jgi:hypothetical protein
VARVDLKRGGRQSRSALFGPALQRGAVPTRCRGAARPAGGVDDDDLALLPSSASSKPWRVFTEQNSAPKSLAKRSSCSIAPTRKASQEMSFTERFCSRMAYASFAAVVVLPTLSADQRDLKVPRRASGWAVVAPFADDCLERLLVGLASPLVHLGANVRAKLPSMPAALSSFFSGADACARRGRLAYRAGCREPSSASIPEPTAAAAAVGRVAREQCAQGAYLVAVRRPSMSSRSRCMVKRALSAKTCGFAAACFSRRPLPELRRSEQAEQRCLLGALVASTT